MRRFGLIVVLAGCGLPEEDFLTEAIHLTCVQAEACGEIELVGGSYDACVEELTGTTPLPSETPGCAYDAGAAQDCLDARADQGCEDRDDLPPACDEVCG